MAALTSQLSELPVDPDTGIFKLFIGKGFVTYFLSNVIHYLDSRSLLSFIETSFIKHVTDKYQDETLKNCCAVLIRKEKRKRLGQLNEKYKNIKGNYVLPESGSVVVMDVNTGEVLVSAMKAKKIKGWDALVKAYENNQYKKISC